MSNPLEKFGIQVHVFRQNHPQISGVLESTNRYKHYYGLFLIAILYLTGCAPDQLPLDYTAEPIIPEQIPFPTPTLEPSIWLEAFMEHGFTDWNSGNNFGFQDVVDPSTAKMLGDARETACQDFLQQVQEIDLHTSDPSQGKAFNEEQLRRMVSGCGRAITDNLIKHNGQWPSADVPPNFLSSPAHDLAMRAWEHYISGHSISAVSIHGLEATTALTNAINNASPQ